MKREERRGERYSPLRFHFNLIKEHAVSAARPIAVEQEFLIRAAQGAILGVIVEIAREIHIEQSPHISVLALSVGF